MVELPNILEMKDKFKFLSYFSLTPYPVEGTATRKTLKGQRIYKM